MRPLGSCILAILCLLPALDGCDSAGGRGGSSGFDISGENAAIRAALKRRQCVDFESLNICPAEPRAAANTPTAAPHVNTDLATATSIDCLQAVPGGPCTYVLRFVAQGFAPGTTFQALSRVDAADNPWVLGPDPRVGGADPSSFSTTLVLTRGVPPVVGPPAQVQFAILAFAGPPPSSTEVGQLHEAEATYAFMTQELVVNVIPPPTASPTPTSTSTPTGPTPTPGPNDCCQCESSCAPVVHGSCGTCTLVHGSTCDGGQLCSNSSPTPTPTVPSPTQTPTVPSTCKDCTNPNVFVPINGHVTLIDTTTNLVRANIDVPIDSQLTGIAASPTDPVVWVGGGSGTVSVLDTNKNSVVRWGAVGRQPYAIGFTPDGATAYVTDLGLNSIFVVDAKTLQTGPAIAGGNQPVALAATPDGAFVYVVNTCGNGACFPISRGTVSIIDTHSTAITKTLTLGYRSNGIAMEPSGRFALVANSCGEDVECASEGTLSVIDTGTQTVVDDIHIVGQFGSQSVAVTPDGRFAYVTNTCGSSPPAGCSESDGSVSVVDLLTNSVVGPALPVLGQPVGIAIGPGGRFAYVTAGLSGSVVVIDTLFPSAPGVDAYIGVGPHPGFLAIAASFVRTPTPPVPTATATPTPQPTASSGVVGTGTADSCTDAALNAALARFPLVTFNCGGPATIDLSATGSKTIAADTLIDGGGLITIDGGNTGLVFQVAAGVAFTVQNLTVASGAIVNEGTLSVTNTTFSGHSGLDSAIHNRGGGTLTVTGSTFSGNGGGGAILNEGTLSVSNSTFSSNSGAIDNRAALSVTGSTFSDNIGAIRNSGTLATVTSSTFSGNSPLSCGPHSPLCGGSAIDNSTTLTATNCTFSGNHGIYGTIYNRAGATLGVTNGAFADNGDGAVLNEGNLNVTNTTFSDNRASGGGAGAIGNSGSLSVTSSTFSGNNSAGRCEYSFGGRPVCSGGWGGAIGNTGMLSVANSTFAGNSAIRDCLETTCGGGGGGAIYNAGAAGTLTVLNSTFFDNSARNNGGIIGNATTCGPTGTAPCSATLTNTLVANSTSGGNCAGRITDGGHNLDDGASCGFSTANGSLINTDPQLDSLGLQDNGGPTQTIALQAGSAAIDAGDDATCSAAPVDHLDQRGFTRPGTGHTNCSIGAYEFAGAPSGQPTLEVK